ncbi:MAG: hypothetical protein R3B70_43140 [Polyangiaceae bacterium]
MRKWVWLPLLALAAGCGEREAMWESTAYGEPFAVHGMKGAVAIVDVSAERVIFASPASADELSFMSSPVSRGYATSAPTDGGARLAVLASGDFPRRTDDDQGPSLQVLDPSSEPPAVIEYPLGDPLSGLEIDPESEYAVIYPGGGEASFVQNPNELVLVKLGEPPSATNPVPASLRSYGGRPEGFTFTPELSLPGGARRLLVVRTDRDVALIDLAEPEKPEITVKLTAGAVAPKPAGIAVTDGDADDPDDARIAIRLAGDPNVVLLDLLPTPADKTATSPHAFTPVPNIVDVGGVPTDVTFGRTDGGLRLLAPVPSRKALALVEPATGVTSEVDLGYSFQRISLVTDVVGESDGGGDVALLWSTDSPAVAFVALGGAVGKPYKSVEVRTLEQPVSSVLDVPAPNNHLKILASQNGSGFVVLNLLSRTTTPLLASATDTHAVVSSDGERLWLSSESRSALARVGLSELHPRNLQLYQRVSRVFDLERKDQGRALVTLDTAGSMAFTLLDAKTPDLTQSREYLGILLGDYAKEEAQ